MAIERIELGGVGDGAGPTGSVDRYEALEGLHRACRGRAAILAFGFTDQDLRVVLEDVGSGGIARALVAFKVSRARAGHRVRSSDRWIADSEPLEQIIAWAHRAPVEAGDVAAPLDSAWTSHRDLMGYRVAPFYDASALLARIDRVRVHDLAGGGRLPDGWPPRRPRAEPLMTLLRVAAAVSGVVPGDRRCFRLFVQLARRRGWAVPEVARALLLTPRRIRQIAGESDRRVEVAMVWLGETALR